MANVQITDLHPSNKLVELSNEELNLQGGFWGFVAALVIGYAIGRASKGDGETNLTVTIPSGGGGGGGLAVYNVLQ